MPAFTGVEVKARLGSESHELGAIMTFQQAISTCLSKYAVVNGRASRSEYWWFVLFSTIAPTAAGLLSDTLSGLVGLGLLVPSIAAGTRRLHDTGRSGWWQLLSFTGIGFILLIIWWCFASEPANNKYGDVPTA